MALIVHKYGGTSMGSPERIRSVAKRVAKWARAGHQMVVVPSAMSGETNRLLGLAKELSPERTTDPSTMASTLSSRAICARGLCDPLSCITEVRDTMRRFGIFASSVISSSVIPSAKYSSLVPGDRSSRGNTASERIDRSDG